jgi:hypothetical protein
MATTYQLISSVTVGSGGAANIEFTSIPQTYTDLLIKGTSRHSNGNGIGEEITFNSNTSNYSNRNLNGSGSGTGSQTTLGRFSNIGTRSSDTANTFSNFDIYIPNYTSSNNKCYAGDSVMENNATESYQYIIGGLWADSSAITSIIIAPFSGNGNYVQYSTFYLYGISNA